MKTNLPPVEEAILLAEARMLIAKYVPQKYSVDMTDDAVVEMIISTGRSLIKAFRKVIENLDKTHPGWRKLYGIEDDPNR